MEKIKINLIINNPDVPYKYNGDAKEYNDIIEFYNKDENVIYDKTMNRITKTNKNNTIIIDFINKEIIIKYKENELRTNIKLLKEEKEENRFYYLYELEKNKIEFILEKEV